MMIATATLDAESIFDATVTVARSEAHLAPVAQRATNLMIRRYAAVTGFDIETAARFVAAELND